MTEFLQPQETSFTSQWRDGYPAAQEFLGLQHSLGARVAKKKLSRGWRWGHCSISKVEYLPCCIRPTMYWRIRCE
jgi:hypothetical protein